MPEIELDLQLDLPSGSGRRSALESALRSSIRSGRLPADSVLPSSRALAADLGVSRSTIVAAYEQLTAEGYLNSTHGSATRVAKLQAPGASGAEREIMGRGPTHDFRPGEPDGSSFPRTLWMRSLRRVLGQATDDELSYPDPRGLPELRSVIAAYLGRTRTVVADGPAVRIVAGYSAGLGFLADTFRRRGIMRIGVEDPTLPIYTGLLRAAGLRTVPIPLDREGIDVERLRDANVGAVVVTPAHQYPTGVTMSASRRADLVGWARERQAWIIEDDYDGEYRYDRRPVGSLQGLGADRVVYAGTASKSLTPTLRLGWLVVPEPLRDDLLHVSNMRSAVSGIDQLTLIDFIERGEFDRHVRHMRTIYRRRNDALRAALGEVAPWLDLGSGSAGLHLMARLTTDHVDETEVLAVCDAAAVGMLGLVTHHGSAAAGHGFAIGFSRPSEHRFPAALDALSDALRSL